MNPLDYSLCDQTVTFYRKIGDEIHRKVADNCHLSCKVRIATEPHGKSMEKKFLLIIPGDEIPLLPGDRIFVGVGPMEVDWDRFVPAAVAELFEAGFAKACYWDGELTHWEAGNRKETL